MGRRGRADRQRNPRPRSIRRVGADRRRGSAAGPARTASPVPPAGVVHRTRNERGRNHQDHYRPHPRQAAQCGTDTLMLASHGVQDLRELAGSVVGRGRNFKLRMGESDARKPGIV